MESRSEVGMERREETKVGYSMARVIARTHVRNARFKCDEERKKERAAAEEKEKGYAGEREIRERLRWMNNETPQRHHISDTPFGLVPNVLPPVSFLVAYPRVSRGLYFKRL